MIVKEISLEGFVAVLTDDPKEPKKANNICGYSHSGEKLWSIEDILSPVLGACKDEWYPDMNEDNGNLSVLSFRGVRYLIDGKTGCLIKSFIVK